MNSDWWQEIYKVQEEWERTLPPFQSPIDKKYCVEVGYHRKAVHEQLMILLSGLKKGSLTLEQSNLLKKHIIQLMKDQMIHYCTQQQKKSL